jgi:5-methylthioribose kinase
VIHVARASGDDLVLKQARNRLNVAEPWFCGVDRIWREVEVLRHCQSLVNAKRLSAPLLLEVPQLLFEDRENFLYAMSAAPSDHVVWKNELLDGAARTDVVRSCGTLLGALHAGSWHDESTERQLGDRKFFNDLRLDPFYRQIARVHAEGLST